MNTLKTTFGTFEYSSFEMNNGTRSYKLVATPTKEQKMLFAIEFGGIVNTGNWLSF